VPGPGSETELAGGDGMMLRATPYGESDIIVQLVTAEHGKVSALARGARKSHRRFAGTLGLLVLGRHELRQRRRGAELWSLESSSMVREWTALAGDVAAVAHASYAVEVVRELLPAEQPEPAALTLLIELHDALAERGPSPSVLRAFEIALLDAIGSGPSLDRCVGCGATDTLDLPGTIVDVARGGVACPGCAALTRGSGVRALSPAARGYLMAVREAPSLAAAADLDADDDLVHERHVARDCLVAMVVGLIGHPLRSLEFIAKMRSGT
jgi:DNA repair protein RecO (recombination protein O)